MEGWKLHMESDQGRKGAIPCTANRVSSENRISEQPAFAWWIKYFLKKRDHIVLKNASKYWQRTHKYRVRIPKLVKEALQIDKENWDTKWWEAIFKEMGNVIPAYRSTRGLRLTYQLDTNKLNTTLYLTSRWEKTSEERRD